MSRFVLAAAVSLGVAGILSCSTVTYGDDSELNRRATDAVLQLEEHVKVPNPPFTAASVQAIREQLIAVEEELRQKPTFDSLTPPGEPAPASGDPSSALQDTASAVGSRQALPIASSPSDAQPAPQRCETVFEEVCMPVSERRCLPVRGCFGVIRGYKAICVTSHKKILVPRTKCVPVQKHLMTIRERLTSDITSSIEALDEMLAQLNQNTIPATLEAEVRRAYALLEVVRDLSR